MQNNDKLRFIFRHPIWVYVFVYALAHFWILLLGNARYWDDWIFSRTPASDILSQFDQTGSMFNMVGYLHVLLQPIGGWSYKVGTFFRSEEHTSELQSLMRISYAVFCLKKKRDKE